MFEENGSIVFLRTGVSTRWLENSYGYLGTRGTHAAKFVLPFVGYVMPVIFQDKISLCRLRRSFSNVNIDF